jgi:hypothetical protein
MAFIVKRDAVVIPAGILVATTSTVKLLMFNPYDLYGSYFANHNKVNLGTTNGDFTVVNGLMYIGYGYGNAYRSFVMAPNTTILDNSSNWGGNRNLSSSSTWSYYLIDYDNENYYYSVNSIYTNASTDPSKIPIDGWSNQMTISIP